MEITCKSNPMLKKHKVWIDPRNEGNATFFLKAKNVI